MRVYTADLERMGLNRNTETMGTAAAYLTAALVSVVVLLQSRRPARASHYKLERQRTCPSLVNTATGETIVFTIADLERAG
jgi:hypothetical protein